MYYAVEMCGNEYSLNRTIGRDVRTRKFQHLHLRHFVRLPHHYQSLENSRTYQDLALKFPGLSRTKPIFQDFPGPGNCIQKIQDFPGEWEPCTFTASGRALMCIFIYANCKLQLNESNVFYVLHAHGIYQYVYICSIRIVLPCSQNSTIKCYNEHTTDLWIHELSLITTL